MASKDTTNHNYYVLVPMMSTDAVKALISALTIKGYTVGPLSSDEKCYTHDDGNLVIIGQLNVSRSIPDSVDDPRHLVYEEIKETIAALSLKFYMLWVGEVAMCTWGLGNVTAGVPIEDKAATMINAISYRQM